MSLRYVTSNIGDNTFCDLDFFFTYVRIYLLQFFQSHSLAIKALMGLIHSGL